MVGIWPERAQCSGTSRVLYVTNTQRDKLNGTGENENENLLVCK